MRLAQMGAGGDAGSRFGWLAIANPGSAGELLRQLDFPRDTPAGLERGRAVLERALQAASLEPRALPFACHARTEVAAACFGLAALCAVWAATRRFSRAALWCGVAAMVAGLLAVAGAFDALAPSAPQSSLEVVIEPREAARGELLLAAHYDSKTEPLDHVGRAVLFTAGGAAWLGWALAASARRRRAARGLAWLAGLSAIAVALQLYGGRWMRERSHGAIDDGAAAALLVEIATELRAEPLRSTRVRCAWFAGEESGAQGSAHYARTWLSSLPRAVVNLECIGAGPDLAWAAREWTGSRFANAPAALVDVVHRVAKVAGSTPREIPFPIVTDAGSFLRHGIPAITLLDLPPNARTLRHLHGARDRLAAVDGRGLESTQRILRGVLHAFDSERSWPLPAPLPP